MTETASSFEVTACELSFYAPHPTIAGRVTGMVRVQIEEHFMGNETHYPLDLKVKADVEDAGPDQVRTALLAHAAHQLNRLKARHTDKVQNAAE